MPGHVNLRPGDVIRLKFPFSSPPKTKISLCVCLERGLFFIVSSKPYRAAPADSQLMLYAGELPCLDHDSCLDVSKGYELDQQTIEKGAAQGVFRLAASALARIRHAIDGQRYLPEWQRRLALDNFAAELARE